MASDFQTVILAAGNGTRMQSDLPKVLHKIAGMSMLGHVLTAAADTGSVKNIVVTGFGGGAVESEVTRLNIAGAKCVTQKERLGTAHAVAQAAPELASDDTPVLVLCGDAPLITRETLQKVINAAGKTGVAFLGFETDNPGAYGRFLLNEAGALTAIVEAKDASPEQLAIKFCNSGVMCASASLLKALLPKIKNNNAKNEYYLTDIVSEAVAVGRLPAAVFCQEDEVRGVNSKTELAIVERIKQDEIRRKMTDDGVTLIDPNSVYFSYDTRVGRNVLIEPNVFFGEKVTVGDDTHIRAFCHIEGAEIGAGATIGPFARLREGTVLKDEVRVGNFCETKKMTAEEGAKINHLSYVGDAYVGARANIGAGVITCNYDGFSKFETFVGEGAFVGSNAALVAPVRVGKGAIVGAGSVITANTPDNAVAVTRAETSVSEGGAITFRAKRINLKQTGTA